MFIDIILLGLMIIGIASAISAFLVAMIYCVDCQEKKNKRQKDIKNFIAAINRAEIIDK